MSGGRSQQERRDLSGHVTDPKPFPQDQAFLDQRRGVRVGTAQTLNDRPG
jgi:hypothetical protein